MQSLIKYFLLLKVIRKNKVFCQSKLFRNLLAGSSVLALNLLYCFISRGGGNWGQGKPTFFPLNCLYLIAITFVFICHHVYLLHYLRTRRPFQNVKRKRFKMGKVLITN